jgi:hypothetical protein
VIGAKEDRGEGTVGDGGGAVRELDEIGQALALDARELRVRERRVERDIGKDRPRTVEGRRRDV